MSDDISIAIETSCREGGVALGVGDRLAGRIDFDASRRHAAQLIVQLDDLLGRAGLKPGQLQHVYVSAGPGGFTGLRVGITVARMLGDLVAGLQCVAVPTAWAVAENLRDRPWERLAVILDAGEGEAIATTFTRCDGQPVADEPAGPMPTAALAEQLPRPILLTGEGLWYHDIAGDGIELADPALRLATAEGVWRVGRRLAGLGALTTPNHLLPVYARPLRVQRPGGDQQAT